MSRAGPKLRSLAKRLIADEAQGNHSPKQPTLAGFGVFEKLRPQLATLMGTGGFRGLLSRALALACDDAAWLRAVHIKSDGTLEGLEKIHAELSPDALSLGTEELLAQLLGLLVTFIGENLTLRLVHEVWPKAPLKSLDLANEEKNEKTE